MQRSSQSIASLAAALAKAQTVLINPEKSLVATIEPSGRAGAAKSFRYAPLSSGLDIVRKTLGEHEIATIQTTAIDHGAGIICLTTVLAHASGEWIASDWPVCAIAETASPHRMGAALTYARRYALFALVGIAGEDDLDAPDLLTPANDGPVLEKPQEGRNGRLNGGQGEPGRRAPSPSGGKVRAVSGKPVLADESSAELRDRLLTGLDTVSSADEAAIWAQRSLPAKNGLTTDDARRVEEAFATRLAALASEEAPATSNGAEQLRTTRVADPDPQEKRSRSEGIDKSVLAVPEQRRVRDRDHVKSVTKQPCLVCGRQPSDAHHLRFAQHPALGRKVSDEFTVPLCRGHHRELHRNGDEADWWRKAGIDPTISARALWLQKHPLPTALTQADVGGTSIAAVGADRGHAAHDRPDNKRHHAKPNTEVGPR